MYTKVELKDFNIYEFLQEHKKDLITVVTGSWYPENDTGSYLYRTIYENRITKLRQKDFESIKSSNRVMLEAILDACQQIKLQDKQLFVLSPTQLGFKKAERGNGPNADIIKQILGVCREKNIEICTIYISYGGEFIREFLKSPFH